MRPPALLLRRDALRRRGAPRPRPACERRLGSCWALIAGLAIAASPTRADEEAPAPAREPEAPTPPPATPPPATPAPPPTGEGNGPTPARRWEIGTVEVTGTAPKPGVVFVEAEREQARRAMRELLQETRGAAFHDVDVSRPETLPEPKARVSRIEVRGPVREGSVLKLLEPELDRFGECRVASPHPLPPVEVEVSLELSFDEEGHPTRSRLVSTRPSAARVGLCALTRLREVAFPPSPAGTVRLSVTLVLPPPLRPATAAGPAALPSAPSSASAATAAAEPSPAAAVAE